MLNLNDLSPKYVAVAGDLHANTRWTINMVIGASERLSKLGEPKPHIMLQAGDFGFWNDRSGLNFLQQTNLALSAKGMVAAVAPGNHENYNFIESWEGDSPPDCPSIYQLPRGTRWIWHGRVWLALGGAVSPDRSVRTDQIDWFPQERITLLQAEKACADGHADVMLTHDAPKGVPLQYMNPPPSSFAPEDLRMSEQHRELMFSVVNEVEPSYLIHGHYHQGYPMWRKIIMPHGTLNVASLHMDGCTGNWGILNTQTMEWVHTEQILGRDTSLVP
jgi:hypothetical protein